MADITRIEYTKKDLLTLMLKDQGIHEGHWVLGVKFIFTAMNIGQSPDGSDASPASVAAVDTIHLERVPEPLPFSVDAGEINPMK
ncbi:hypothetical protein JWG42_15590 [Desulfoprunum benzoelyticum]|uniref:Uncharacterized protein n=1 Tax=Desulfoprunum benzoelyticum TaxID=1506996 RepID=A0A840UT97_9BACT|nr:hypothetical protein [Desulfoprunum benzoelyticum]MBB5348066.1 hypothetical protein [Desulfoprunum benzoelyticum]MBM9531580.1 hypothetical protein [Desulfoprunum benzoelyticum]